MNRKTFQIAMWFEWLVIPFVALRYWTVWDRLPSRIATHFNAVGQPDGWMSRQASLWFVIILLTFLLSFFGVIVYLTEKSRAKTFAWAMLGFSYFIVAVVVLGNEAVLQYNLTGHSINFAPYMLAIPVVVVALIVAILAPHRGSELPAARSIAEEVHGSAVWGVAFLLLGSLSLVAFGRIGLNAEAIPFGFTAVVLLGVGIAAWSGFHYYFTLQGIEVRTLGFRLKSIPVQHIQRYAVDRWNALRGYGIRGLGNSRAYVWGNQGIWITTAQERVFLGHSQPERLVRDMDRMMKFVKI